MSIVSQQYSRAICILPLFTSAKSPARFATALKLVWISALALSVSLALCNVAVKQELVEHNDFLLGKFQDSDATVDASNWSIPNQENLACSLLDDISEHGSFWSGIYPCCLEVPADLYSHLKQQLERADANVHQPSPRRAASREQRLDFIQLYNLLFAIAACKLSGSFLWSCIVGIGLDPGSRHPLLPCLFPLRWVGLFLAHKIQLEIPKRTDRRASASFTPLACDFFRPILYWSLAQQWNWSYVDKPWMDSVVILLPITRAKARQMPSCLLYIFIQCRSKPGLGI